LEVDDFRNPSLTMVLLETFTGDVRTDIDPDDDGDAEDLQTFGKVFDALGVVNDAGDNDKVYGAQLGGDDFALNTLQLRLVFRERTTDRWFGIQRATNPRIYDTANTQVDPVDFEPNPLTPTFDDLNPAFIPLD